MKIEYKKYYDVIKSSSDNIFEAGDSFYLDDDQETICIESPKGKWVELSMDDYEQSTKDFIAKVNPDYEPIVLLNTTGITWFNKKLIKIRNIDDE